MKIFIMSSVHRWDDTRVFHKEAVSLAKSYTVELHAPAPFNHKSLHGVEIFGLPRWKKEKDRIKLWWILFRRAFKSDAAVFHFHDPELIPLAFFLKLLTKKVVIYDVHEHISNDILDKEWIPKQVRRLIAWIFILCERISVPTFNAVIYTTPMVGESYRKTAKRAVSIENYPMPSVFRQLKSGTKQNEIKNIIYLGRVLRVRGVEEIIKSWSQVIKKHQEARFLIVGDIVPDEYRFYLQNLTKQHCLENYIKFYGFVPYEDAVKYLASAVAGVVTFLPKKNNMSCLPNKLFEYMASGLPVVASDFPLYREVVKFSNCGILVDPLDVDELSEAFNYLIEHPVEARQMGKSGLTAFYERFNWPQEEKKLLALYKELRVT